MTVQHTVHMNIHYISRKCRRILSDV